MLIGKQTSQMWQEGQSHLQLTKEQLLIKRTFIPAMLLLSVVAWAQSGSKPEPSTRQQPQQPATQQQEQPATQPGTEPGVQTSTGQTAMKGCLKQSGGNWVLAAENGQTVNLSGDSSVLKPHDGREVQLQGTQASDGSFQVSSVSVVSDACISPR
jgi:hypothetical protein